MRTYTNMTWPDDPYRTGQQLYRRPVPRLAAFTAERTAADGRPGPAAVAIVYLPLHRTQAISVTEQTLTFGFRAASTDDAAEAPGLAAVADLDLMQARRHAAVLAGAPAGRRPGRPAAGRRRGGATGAGSRRARMGGPRSGGGPGGDVRLRARPARLPAAGAGLPAGRDRHRLRRLVAWRGPASRPPGCGAGGGAGADDRAGLRPAPGPL